MEGEGSKPLPEESASKGSSTKLIVAIVAIIVVVAAIGGALLLMGGGSKEPDNKAPIAVLKAVSVIIDSGQSVELNATGSSDPDGTIVAYVWHFGDGTKQTTTTVKVTHAYYMQGAYLAIVEVVDNKAKSGFSWTTPASITVNPPGASEIPLDDSVPVVVLATSGGLITTADKVDFDGTSSFAFSTDGSTAPGPGDDVDKMIWNFGDGASKVGTYAADAALNHTYVALAGAVCEASLTVFSVHGTYATAYATIIVKPTGGGGGGIKHPDTFIKATFGEPQSLDPAWDYESAGGEVLQQVYETLVAWNGSSASELKPMLAMVVPSKANGGISADDLHYTFHLRPNVEFHNGEIMSADDVVYSIKRVLFMNDPEGAAWMLGNVMLPSYTGLGSAVDPAEVNASIIKVDSLTVTFNLVRPYAPFLSVMAYTVGSIVSKKYVEDHGGYAPLTKNPFMNRNMCGTGPYTLQQWKVNQQIIMERFANYWRDPAPVKYIIIKKVQDTSTREMMILSGEADFIALAVMFRADVQGKPGVFLQDSLPMFSISFFGPNQNITPGLEIGDVPRTFFADRNVRLAMVHAFDYETFLREVALNTAVQPNGPIPAPMLGYDPTIPLYDYNLTKVANYLKAAVDTRPGHTGSYADNGFTLMLYYNAGNVGRQAGCALLKRGLEEISENPAYGVTGTITVSSTAMDWPSYLDARAARTLPLFFLGWNVDFPDPDDFADPFCNQNGSFPIYIGLRNDSLTGLVRQAAQESDPTVRATIYSQISMSCYVNGYYLWTTQPTNIEVHRTWVQGWYYNPTFSEMPGYYYDLTKALPT